MRALETAPRVIDKMLSVHAIDPLNDARWPRFVERHPAAGLFPQQRVAGRIKSDVWV